MNYIRWVLLISGVGMIAIIWWLEYFNDKAECLRHTIPFMIYATLLIIICFGWGIYSASKMDK